MKTRPVSKGVKPACLKQQKSVRYLIIAGSLLVIASHFYINAELVLASTTAVLGIIFSYLGLKRQAE